MMVMSQSTSATVVFSGPPSPTSLQPKMGHKREARTTTVRFANQLEVEHECAHTCDEIKVMWYTSKHFSSFKARAKKQSQVNKRLVAKYEAALRDTYSACRGAVLVDQDDDDDSESGDSFCAEESQPVIVLNKTPVPLHQLEALSQSMAQMTTTRLGLEKNTVLCDRMSGRRQLLAGIQKLQSLNKPNCSQQIASLAQRTSQPACLFAHILALAVARNVQQHVMEGEDDDLSALSSVEAADVEENSDDELLGSGSCHSTQTFSRKLSQSASRIFKKRSQSPDALDSASSHSIIKMGLSVVSKAASRGRIR